MTNKEIFFKCLHKVYSNWEFLTSGSRLDPTEFSIDQKLWVRNRKDKKIRSVCFLRVGPKAIEHMTIEDWMSNYENILGRMIQIEADNGN